MQYTLYGVFRLRRNLGNSRFAARVSPSHSLYLSNGYLMVEADISTFLNQRVLCKGIQMYTFIPEDKC